MKKILLFFVAVIGIAGLAAFAVLRWTENREVAVSDVAAHRWLHRELQVTGAQHEALEPIEAKFAEKERLLLEQIHAANLSLAHVMAEDKAYTPRVAAEVERVHLSTGNLQKASIEHLFEMRTVLTPEQGKKLLDLAERALDQTP